MRGHIQQEVEVPRSSNAPVHESEATDELTDEAEWWLHEESVSYDLEPLSEQSHVGQYAVVPSAEVDGWMLALDARTDPAVENADDFTPTPELRAVTDNVLATWEAAAPARFGRSTRDALRHSLTEAMRWVERSFDPTKGTIDAFACSTVRLVERRFAQGVGDGDARAGFRLLHAEHADEVAREAARSSERACGEYLGAVRALVLSYCTRRGQRIETATEHADAVMLRVLERIREPGDGFAPHVQIARPAWWRISNELRAERRRKERMWLVKAPVEFPHARFPQPDVALSNKQLEAEFDGRVVETLRGHLSKTQLKYLDAIIVEIQLAWALRGTGRIRGIPARVAERLGKDPAQVSRAIRRIAKIASDLGLEDYMHMPD